jgi:hypothetical protein
MNNLCTLLSNALDCDAGKIKTDTKIGDIDEWDSLGELAVLTALSVASDGKSDSIDLTDLKSVDELERILKENSIEI